MDFLKIWLLFAGSLRSLSVVLGYLDKIHFQERVFVLAVDEVTALQARTFSVWTLLTCFLCVLCALNINNRTIYIATLFSFAAALGFFSLEFFIYHTISFSALLPILFVAGVSLCWMPFRIPPIERIKDKRI